MPTTTSPTRAINPLDYIVDWDPKDEKVPDVDAWYVTEYLTITVTKTAGVAMGNAASFGPESVGWLLAQGWVMLRAYNGRGDILWQRQRAGGTRHFSDGSSMSYSSSADAPVGQWHSQTADFQRVRVNPRVILKHMVAEFTKGYNEGRRLNDQRYDELVHLYAAIVVRTQGDVEPFRAAADRFAPLVEQIVRSLDGVPEDYAGKVDAVVERLGGGEEAVNERFDELVAKAKSGLVERGLYNSTLWAATIAEIERQRAIALDEIRSKNATLRLDALKGAAALRAQIADAILGVVQKMTLEPVQIRNRAFADMFAFMERRTDDYPGLADIAKIVTQVGYANGGTLVPTSK